jgi:hypothetical protein
MGHVTRKLLDQPAPEPGTGSEAVEFSLYVIKSHLTPKLYVGVTRRTIEQRFGEHVCAANYGSNLLLHMAMQKYGKENFRPELLAMVTGEAEAQARERALMEQFESFVPGGYNMTRGGETPDADLCSVYATEIWGREEFRKLRKKQAANRRRTRARAKAKALMEPGAGGGNGSRPIGPAPR